MDPFSNGMQFLNVIYNNKRHDISKFLFFKFLSTLMQGERQIMQVQVYWFLYKRVKVGPDVDSSSMCTDILYWNSILKRRITFIPLQFWKLLYQECVMLCSDRMISLYCMKALWIHLIATIFIIKIWRRYIWSQCNLL